MGVVGSMRDFIICLSRSVVFCASVFFRPGFLMVDGINLGLAFVRFELVVVRGGSPTGIYGAKKWRPGRVPLFLLES